MINHFEESEMPYGTLERFGLTQEMMSSRTSTMVVALPCYLFLLPPRMVRQRLPVQGSVWYALQKEVSMCFSIPNSMSATLICSTNSKSRDFLESNEENKEAGGKRFFQIDPESKQVLCVPMPVIGRNMQYVSDRYHLTGAEMQKLQNGDVLSILNEDDEEISVGIDLNSKTGIRFAAGDEQTWRREAKREWDKYNFGAFGCWVADDNGDLNYVHEEDYSEELWQEQKKMGMRVMQR